MGNLRIYWLCMKNWLCLNNRLQREINTRTHKNKKWRRGKCDASQLTCMPIFFGFIKLTRLSGFLSLEIFCNKKIFWIRWKPVKSIERIFGFSKFIFFSLQYPFLMRWKPISKFRRPFYQDKNITTQAQTVSSYIRWWYKYERQPTEKKKKNEYFVIIS